MLLKSFMAGQEYSPSPNYRTCWFWWREVFESSSWNLTHLKPQTNQTLNSMQDIMQWYEDGGRMDGRVNEGWISWKRWVFGNYTCETQQWAHTPLMQSNSGTTGKTLKCFRECLRYGLKYTVTHKTPTPPANTLKAILILNQVLHPEEFPTTYHN